VVFGGVQASFDHCIVRQFGCFPLEFCPKMARQQSQRINLLNLTKVDVQSLTVSNDRSSSNQLVDNTCDSRRPCISSTTLADLSQ